MIGAGVVETHEMGEPPIEFARGGRPIARVVRFEKAEAELRRRQKRCWSAVGLPQRGAQPADALAMPARRPPEQGERGGGLERLHAAAGLQQRAERGVKIVDLRLEPGKPVILGHEIGGARLQAKAEKCAA